MSSISEFHSKVQKIHQRLGIPASYADKSLRLYPEPDVLVATEPDFYKRPQQLTPETFQAWCQMKAAAAKTGVSLFLISAYRSLDYQAVLIEKKLASGQSINTILKVNAAPGYSEHHSGRAIDLGTPGCDALLESFENTAAFEWLQAHAGDFGFVLSYPRDNEAGIIYEPWHWCFQAAVQPASDV